jgi:glycosyltransferase involved in cell wall biosynthesis
MATAPLTQTTLFPAPDARRVKVLLLNSCISGGGAGRSLQEYLEHKDPRVELHLVMPEPGVIGPAIAPQVERVWYVPDFVERIHRSPYRWAERFESRALHMVLNWFAIPRATAKIIQIARELKPDVIYCNHMLANPVGAYVGHHLGIPVVFHARNIHVAWFGRKFYYFLASLKCVRGIICNSLASSLLYREYTEDKVRVVYNFLDLKRFDQAQVTRRLRREFNIPEDALVVGYVGRILQKKGIDVLIRAFETVHKKFENAYLVIVGDNDGGLHHDLRAEYEQLANRLGLSNRTIFTGFKPDIRPYISDFDVLALPSVEPESFGRVLIEAMALGVPSVVSAHGGAVEVVRHGLNGLWTRPGDATDLAKAIVNLLGNKELRHNLGSYGVSHVRENFSGDELSRQITETLIEVGSHQPSVLPERNRLRRWFSPPRISQPH